MTYLPTPIGGTAASALTGANGLTVIQNGLSKQTTLAALQIFINSGTTPTAVETLTVTTPAAQLTNTAFTLRGTYTNGPPTALDYSTNGSTTWTAAPSPVIGSGAYSFSVTLTAVAASQTIVVRDHTTQSITATSAAFAVTAPPVAQTPTVESANGTVITVAGTQLRDAAGNIYSFNGAGYVVTNGTAETTTTTGVTAIAYLNHQLYQKNNLGNWYTRTGPTAVYTGPTADPTVAAPSVDGMTLNSASGVLYDAVSQAWTLSAASLGGLGINRNGTYISPTANVALLLYYQTVIYQKNAAGNWYGWSGTTFVDLAGDPRSTSGLSGNTTAAGPGPAASSSFITADFANLTSPAGASNVVVRPQLFGVASGGFDNNNWQWVNNATFRSRMRALNLPLFRVHSQWQQKGNNIATLAANIGSMVPSNCTMVIGLYNPSSGQSVSNAWRTGSSIPCTLWEGGNEDTKFSQSSINTMIASLQADNPANRVAGDTNAGFTTGNLSGLVSSMSGSTLGLLDQHQYLYCNGADYTPTNAQACLATFPGNSGTAAVPNYYRTKTQALDGAIGSGYGASLPYLMGEFNIECGASSSDLRAGTSIGACFLISSLFNMQEGTNRPIYGAVWDAMDDGGAAYNLIDGNFNCYPQYYTLQRLIATMPGNLVNTASGSNAGGVKAWATSNGGNYGVAIVNSNSSNASGPVALSHWPVNTTGNGTATLWTYPTTNLSSPAANTPGVVSTVSVSNGVTQSITVPANSCVILST